MKSEMNLMTVIKERNEAQKLLKTGRVKLEKLKTEMRDKLIQKDQDHRDLKILLDEKVIEAKECENYSKEVLKLKKKISALKLKMSRLEESRLDLKDSLKERENELETERMNKKRSLIAEKRKSKQINEKMNQLKKEHDKKIIQLESLKRDNGEVEDTNLDTSKRYHSPREQRRGKYVNETRFNTTQKKEKRVRGMRFDSPCHTQINLTSNLNESVYTI
jgi:chromosome segregation ATPase